MVLQSNSSVSTTKIRQMTKNKAENNSTATSLYGFSNGNNNKNNAQMVEHRAYVRNYLAEERKLKPILPSNKNTCPSKSSNATRTSLNGLSEGFFGSEFENKRKNYIRDHYTDYQKYSKQYNAKFLEHVSQESKPHPAKKNGISETRIYDLNRKKSISETAHKKDNNVTFNVASKHTDQDQSNREHHKKIKDENQTLLSKKTSKNFSEVTKPFYEFRPGEQLKDIPRLRSFRGEDTEYSSSYGNNSIVKNNKRDNQKDMSKHKEDYLERTNSESGYGFVKTKRPLPKQTTTVMRPATREYHENRAKANKTEIPFLSDGKQVWHRNENENNHRHTTLIIPLDRANENHKGSSEKQKNVI